MWGWRSWLSRMVEAHETAVRFCFPAPLIKKGYIMKLGLTIAFILFATAANATSWTIEDGHGGWIDNPNCTGSCHDTGIPNGPETPTVTVDPKTSERPDQSGANPQYGFCCVKDDHLYFNVIPGGNEMVAKAECKDLQNKSRTAQCSPIIKALINKK